MLLLTTRSVAGCAAEFCDNSKGEIIAYSKSTAQRNLNDEFPLLLLWKILVLTTQMPCNKSYQRKVRQERSICKSVRNDRKGHHQDEIVTLIDHTSEKCVF